MIGQSYYSGIIGYICQHSAALENRLAVGFNIILCDFLFR